MKAVVQVQQNAPAKLLVGTDTLSQLGFMFISTGEEEDVDMLEPASKQGDSKQGVVSLLRSVRLPGQHSKLVRATEGVHGHRTSRTCWTRKVVATPSWNYNKKKVTL